MKKFLCPYCYENHSPTDCKLSCDYNVAGKAVQCKNNIDKDKNGYVINLKDYKTCLNCTTARKLLHCVNTDYKVIPKACTESAGLPVSLLGAKEAGKSNYIAVLVNEIRRNMTGKFDCNMSLTDDPLTKSVYDNNYYEPLFTKKEVVAFTDRGRVIPPLLFPINFFNGKALTLTFYDTAGENLDDENDMSIYNRYIPNSKGIILLLDPLQVDWVRDRLKGRDVRLPYKNTDALDVIDRIIVNIRNIKNIKAGKHIDIPLAVVFTKIDVLEKYDLLPEYSCLKEESKHLEQGAFVWQDFENTDKEMRDLMEVSLGAELMQKVKTFTQSAFFGVSAFGDIPNGTKLSSAIRPRRVLDPLLWLLSLNKIIKTVK